MSRILRRPMFRGGGKVSSYGNGIASGMGYAGGGQIGGGAVYGQLMPDGRYGFQQPFIPIGQTKSQIDAAKQAINQMYGIADDFADVGTKKPVQNTGGNILKRNINKLKNLRFGSMAAPATAVGSGLAALSVGAPIGAGIGQLADFYAKSTSTPEGYRRLKEMGGPKMTFDETNIDVGQDLDYIAQGNMIGEKPGFFPRGGKAKFYEDRGYNPDGTLKQILDDQTKDGKDPALEAAENDPNKEITVNDEGEPVLSKKERLDKAAKEYEDILGAGIKRDSIFDAMIEGGTRLYEGEGAGAAIRAANKALDPIQNIKTASRKLAVEEDIAIRKALAVAKGKSNATRDLIEQYKKAGLNDREIANRLSNNEVELEVIVQKMGSKPEGYKEFVRKKYPGVNILQETDPKKIDTSLLDDGRHYITYPTDAFIEVKDGKLVGKIDYR
jgi:hypothetical protein